VSAGRFVLSGAAGGFATWNERGDVRVDVEGQCPAGWAEGLAARGHRVQGFPAFDHHFGHAHVITVADDHLAGATDPRPRTGLAAGY
jgi:gamma-glutamyltranspeptidase